MINEYMNLAEFELNKMFEKHYRAVRRKSQRFVEAEKYRLMWGMCYDKYDKAALLDYLLNFPFKNGERRNRWQALSQRCMCNKFEQTVLDYMKKAPTWNDGTLTFAS